MHAKIKHLEMIERIIIASSNPGDLVLDMFSGSGTTSRIAQKLGRNYIGCEKNDEYIKIIEEGGLNYDRL